MQRIIRNNILKYVPEKFSIEYQVNPNRIFNLTKSNGAKKGKVVYLCEREIRAKDNFALRFAIEKSKELNLPLKIVHPKINYEIETKQRFIEKQIELAKISFLKTELDFQISSKKPAEILNEMSIAVLIIDFNPILKRDYLRKADYEVYEIDGHNIIPAKFLSEKQEYSAFTIRRKIYLNIYPFLTEYNNIVQEKTEADFVLENFIKNRLQNYARCKNNPSENVLSGLSKYLNMGFISAQRAAIEVIKSDVEEINKEAFLEELIVRKELADNFCLYAKNYKNFSGTPSWAKLSLMAHKDDLRAHIYSLKDFETAQTNDILWNTAQKQLIREGTIHGYLRMYWAKKMLEWTISPQQALDIAIYLNDKYAYDAPSANGYVGILWAIGGLHDRAFIDYPVTGKIRRMTFDSLKRKIDLNPYIKKYS